MSYPRLKELAVRLIDDFSDLDIIANYGDKFNSKTKLDSIELTFFVRGVMQVRVNKVFSSEFDDWKGVRPIDTAKCESIGDFIALCAKRANVSIPEGEPK